MKHFTVYWEVNDGRFGYSNITAELDWSGVFCRSYIQAIREHANKRNVLKILSISETMGKGSKGKINGQNYRDFFVTYLSKNVTFEKEIYLDGEVVSKIVRVFSE
ncbi:hypothetical protein DSECCO2_501920 [anaerobic digester metagenome]